MTLSLFIAGALCKRSSTTGQLSFTSMSMLDLWQITLRMVRGSVLEY